MCRNENKWQFRPGLAVRQCLFSFAMILLLVSCGKDEPLPPIIEPGSWYPVYPGSWWKYSVNDSLIITDSTSDDYIVHSFKIDRAPDRYSDPARVPLLNGQPIYRYDYVESIYFPSTPYDGVFELWPILSDKVGTVFSAYWVDSRYGTPSEMVYVKSKSFNGKDSVLLLESKWETWNFPGPVYPEVRTRIFTKGIGLTSDVLIDTTNSDTLSKKILIDYFVNHAFTP